jgi:signal transduction histidine kinase
MSDERPGLPGLRHSLSARLLAWTILFVMLAEVLIYTPSIAHFRLDYLEERLADAHIASLALDATPSHMVSPALEMQLLKVVGARLVVREVQGQRRMLILNHDMPPMIDATYDLRSVGWPMLAVDAFVTMLQQKNRVLRVIGPMPYGPGMTIEVVLDERPLRSAMYAYSARIIEVSILISLITAGLVYLTLQWLLVRPMRRITTSMQAFGEHPDDLGARIESSTRRDEVGVAQRELARLQSELGSALREKTRLAALGSAVTKITHDLRNMLATAQLVSDRIAGVEDTTVRRLAPTLVGALDRAIALCLSTMSFAREDPPQPRLARVTLRSILVELAASVAPLAGENSLVFDDVPEGLEIVADPEQLFRVLNNLARNALEAGASRVRISASSGERGVELEVSDDGRGVAPAARQTLFRPFAGSAKAGGMGLGLAIARDLLRAHGGDIELKESRPGATSFRIFLPRRRAAAA